MRIRWALLLLTLVLSTTIARAAEAADAPPRPNIVFILTDDQRWDCLSVAGHPFLKTPNIDRIANEGAYFNNSFVTLPLCSPSRASFLTGKYNHTNGIVANTAAMGPLSHKLDTYPMHLQKAGYETGMIGKLHMGVDDSPRPGFDYWAVFKGQGRYMNCPLNINGTETPTQGYITDVITDKAVDFIRKDHANKPFALYVGHKAVHGPYRPADKYKDLYSSDQIPQRPNVKDDRHDKPALTRKVKEMPKDHPAYGVTDPIIRDQLRCLQSVDDSVGAVLKALEETKQLDNTLVIFSSDNGYFWNEHGFGDKRAAFEESIRVPLVMRYPKLIKAGTKIDAMALNIDLAPTLIELAGAPAIEGVHGRSLLPLLKGETPSDWRTDALFEYYLEQNYPNIPTWHAVRTPQWKYVHYDELEGMDELYDLKNDPYEMKNVIKDEANAKQLEALKAELAKLLEQTK
jgi:N-acetylglucosamine-6-sulfatase